jgi:hypothetical protein
VLRHTATEATSSGSSSNTLQYPEKPCNTLQNPARVSSLTLLWVLERQQPEPQRGTSNHLGALAAQQGESVVLQDCTV